MLTVVKLSLALSRRLLILPVRGLSLSQTLCIEEKKEGNEFEDKFRRVVPRMLYEPVTVDESINYMGSDAYFQTYKGKPVWFYYRRNFKGQMPPSLNRKNCTYKGRIMHKNACPVCRDNHIVLSHKHLELLRQFLDPHSGEPLRPVQVGLCQVQYRQLLLSVELARQLGLLPCAVPLRLYDYHDFYPESSLQSLDGLYSPRSDRPLAAGEPRLPALATTLQLAPPVSALVRPAVPTRYFLEERQYLAKRAAKLAALRAAKVKK